MEKRNLKRVVLVIVLILPISVYLLFIYGLKDVFFKTLTIVGPREVNTTILDNGETVYDTTFYQVPEFTMVNQNGTVVTQDSMLGKFYVASFFFTSCPSICPALNFRLKQISDRFKSYDEFYIVSFSVDPNRDSIEVLKAYADDLGVENRNWQFLTGAEDQTHKLASGFLLGASKDSAAEGGFYHAEGVVIIDWNGNIRSRKDDNGNVIGSYDIMSVSILKDLEEDLKVMKAEYETWQHNLKDGK